MMGSAGGDALEAGLAARDLAIGDVAHLVLTHPHVDHVGQANAVLDAGDPTVYAPASARERLARDADDLASAVRTNATAAGLAGERVEEAVEMAVDSLHRSRDLLPVGAVDRWVAGGDHLALDGREFSAVHTPGHQADHLCFVGRVAGERALFAGDVAIATFRSVSLHDGLGDGVYESIGAFYAALDRLATLDVDRVFPGHGPVHDGFDGAVAQSRRSLDRLLDGTLASLDAGATTALEVAAARAGDDERGVRYEIFETVGALAHLEAEGAVASTLDRDGVRRYEVV